MVLWSTKFSFCRLLATGQFHIDHPVLHLDIDLEAEPLGEINDTEIAERDGLIRCSANKKAFPLGRPFSLSIR